MTCMRFNPCDWKTMIVIMMMAVSVPAFGQAEDCADGIDNDGDGFIDCDDSDCTGQVDCLDVTCSHENQDPAGGWSSSISCEAGGISTGNSWARSYVTAELIEIPCVTVFMINTGDGFQQSKVGIYHDTDGGAPVSPGSDLVLLDFVEVYMPSGNSASGNIVEQQAIFTAPVSIPAGVTYVIAVTMSPGVATGFVSTAGDPADAGEYEVYFKAPDCGVIDYTALSDLGYPGVVWTQVTGDVEFASACPNDVDDSGDIGFQDLLLILSAWGPCAP